MKFLVRFWDERIAPVWPQVLWGLLLAGIGLNMAYLLWPQPPIAVEIHPHPAMMGSYEADFPAVVPPPPSNAEEVMVVDPKADHVVSHHSAKSARHAHTRPSKKDFKGTVHLNTASAEQLMQLTGVGPKMAERILAYRKANGPFSSIAQLTEVKGIGPKKFEKMRAHLAL